MALPLHPKLKRNLGKIFPFGLIWLVTGWVFLFIEQAMIIGMEYQYSPESVIVLSPKIIAFASVSVFAIGCLVGFLEFFIINRYFIKKSFPVKLFSKFFIYAVLLFFLMFVFYHMAASIEMQKTVFSSEVFNKYLTFLTSITNLSTSVQLAFSLVLSLLYAEISEHLGHHVLVNFFNGKYHRPKVEDRVFLFTDLNQSTQIAEQLGHVHYFNFLRDYYAVLSDAILVNYGTVYQYIGDEIVISWQKKDKKATINALHCFFDMQTALHKKQPWFLKTYGISPSFKGGLHSGEVTVGEIGALKKEIFFTGDVLNTASRIQSLSATYQKEILVSEVIYQELQNQDYFQCEFIDTASVKGKTEKLKLYSIV